MKSPRIKERDWQDELYFLGTIVVMVSAAWRWGLAGAIYTFLFYIPVAMLWDTLRAIIDKKDTNHDN